MRHRGWELIVGAFALYWVLFAGIALGQAGLPPPGTTAGAATGTPHPCHAFEQAQHHRPLVLKAINLITPLRVPKEVEFTGLDEALHGESAYIVERRAPAAQPAPRRS